MKDNKNMHIKSKRVLAFIPAFFGYEKAIVEKMRDMGANVDFYNERAVSSACDRAILKVAPGLFKWKSQNYYGDIIKKNNKIEYDYILIVKGDMVTERILDELRNNYPKAKIILYLWDSVKNIAGITKMFSLFDVCYSFDIGDCKKYRELKFRPLFYIDVYKRTESNKEDNEYDISFLGTIHSDRYAIIKKIQKYADMKGLRTFWFMYLQSRFVYRFYKIFKREFRDTEERMFSFEKMLAKDISYIIDHSKAILDMQHPAQTGLTMRTIEMIGMKKKIITTNTSIADYDFYNPNNICIISRENPTIDDCFLNSEYEELPERIYKKYGLDEWILDILEA